VSLTSHLGYGPFRLADFVAGDLFARYDGTLARVCDPQPAGRPDHICVWTQYGTSNAERTWLHRSLMAYAITEEQAWTIERRRKEQEP
jgi:hypothetical protein